MLVQQPVSTQTEHIGLLASQHTQTPLLLQHTASTQAVVGTSDAATQSTTQAEQASAAEQHIQAMHEEVTGLQLKVQALQGIVRIQEEQLTAAARPSSDAIDQVGTHFLLQVQNPMLGGIETALLHCVK